MLIRFMVRNFMSFKNPTEFNMMAGKMTRHSKHVALCNGKRVLKGAFIFGANAGGKTNFIQAISFARNVVMNGLDHVNCDKKYFRIDGDSKSKPTVFQFDIFSNNHFYSYGFAITFKTRKIEEEWLYQIDDQEKCIFLRSQNENGIHEINSDLQFSSEKQKDKFGVYIDDFRSPRMNQTLFLSDTALRSADTEDYQPFREVIEWFARLIIIFPNSTYGAMGQLLDDAYEKTRLENLLNYFDTGINQVENRPIELEKALADFSPELVDRLKVEISKQQRDIHLNSPRSQARIEIKCKDGEVVASHIVSNHGNAEDLFEYADESDGTQRLFDLIPIFQTIYQGAVVIIDELDRSLHTKAVLEFIEYFYSLATSAHSQLIATTHDSNVMDMDYVRQDEIWFVERQEDHSSKLYSLNQFKERFDKKVEKEYLLGRYGAIPIFRQSAFHVHNSEDGDPCGNTSE